MKHPVPPKLTQQRFALPQGLSLRQVAILSAAIACAALIALTLRAPIAIRVFLAVLVSGTGLALAYRTIQGEPPEIWLMRTLMFRLSHRRLLVWRRGEAPRLRRLDEVEPPEPSRSARWHRPVPIEVRGDFSFLGAMANVVILAILSGLSVYMATGGAQQLITYFDFMRGL